MENRKTFDTQFTTAFDYSKGKAFLYLQTGPKGKSDPSFQTAYRWVVEDLTTIYEKQGKSPDEATRLANSYANYHVSPIGYLRDSDFAKIAHEKIVRDGPQAAIDPQARATRKYAGHILLGDTSEFATVLRYAHEK